MLWLTGLCNILLPTLSLVILNTIVVRTIEKHAQVVMIKLMVVLVMMFPQGYQSCKDIDYQGCISCGMCSYPELTKDHVLTSAYVNIFRTVTRNAVNKSA